LTQRGWKRIDRYEEGDLVGEFNPDTGTVELVEPLGYVKLPCTKMIAINPVRGMSQRLSHEHRVLYYNPDGTHGVCSADEYMNLPHPSHHRKYFKSTFTVTNETSIPLSDMRLRLMVAVIADGHFSSNSNQCTIRIKKTRKIERLRALLIKGSVEYDEHTCGGQPDFQVFRFDAPFRQKEFEDNWWSASQRQLELIADELPHWDSAERKADAISFSSFSEKSANFAQYAFAAAKHPASLTFSYRNRTKEGRGTMLEYVVHARAEDKFIGPGRKDCIYEVDNPEGFKYCFEVPTTFLLLRHNGYIFATGNTGKTPVHITDFASRRRKGGGCLLVLCPKSLISCAWGNDFKTFAPDMKVSLAYAENRINAFEADADAYITNIDAATWLVERPDRFWKRFDTLVIDESTSVKHSTSKRSRAVAKFARKFDYRRLLTGTPTSNGICDIWHQMYVVDGGERLGKSFYGFQQACCYPEQVGPNANAIKWHDKPGVEADVGSFIEDVVIRNRFEDCVDIPPNHQYAVSYTLSPRHRKLYDELERDSILILKDEKAITALNGAVLYSKLLQAASGATYSEDDDYVLLDTGRYELIGDLIEARNHSVVFFNWKHQKDQLLKIADKEKWSYAVIDGETTKKGERERIVTNYQAGKYKVLFAHPQSAGHGLTLTRGTTTIFASPTPNLEHFLQDYKRIYRIGQKDKTETIMVVAAGTIDERVWQSCQDKNVKQLDLLEYLRA
jgi:hypothetical protein